MVASRALVVEQLDTAYLSTLGSALAISVVWFLYKYADKKLFFWHTVRGGWLPVISLDLLPLMTEATLSDT